MNDGVNICVKYIYDSCLVLIIHILMILVFDIDIGAGDIGGRRVRPPRESS